MLTKLDINSNFGKKKNFINITTKEFRLDEKEY